MEHTEKATICVYLKTGQVFEYDVIARSINERSALASKAREHAAQIIEKGYRSIQIEGGELTHYPPHWVDKVVVHCNSLTSNYYDRPRAT